MDVEQSDEDEVFFSTGDEAFKDSETQKQQILTHKMSDDLKVSWFSIFSLKFNFSQY